MFECGLYKGYYSQSFEEKYIIEYFKEYTTGIFLDIGAFDGKCLSNTHRLALNGWKGICVEPDKTAFKKLQKLYKEREDIELYCLCIGDRNETVTFYDSKGEACSTTNINEMKRVSAGGKISFKSITSEMITVTELINRSKYKTIDFVNIDIEDCDLGMKILEELDVVKREVSLICFEGLASHKNALQKSLKEIGFSKLEGKQICSQNILLVKDEYGNSKSGKGEG